MESFSSHDWDRNFSFSPLICNSSPNAFFLPFSWRGRGRLSLLLTFPHRGRFRRGLSSILPGRAEAQPESEGGLGKRNKRIKSAQRVDYGAFVINSVVLGLFVVASVTVGRTLIVKVPDLPKLASSVQSLTLTISFTPPGNTPSAARIIG